MSEIKKLEKEIEALEKFSTTMILRELSPRFYKMEVEAFEEYKEASPEEKDRICKEVAEKQAKILMEEINAEVERRCAK